MSCLGDHPTGDRVTPRTRPRQWTFWAILASGLLLGTQGVRAGQGSTIQEFWHFEAGG